MIQLKPRKKTFKTTPAQDSKETLNKTKVAPVTSGVSHWITPAIYFLGRRLLMPLYFGKLKVTGQENIPRTGPVILAPTHRSRWDGLLIPYAAGKPITGRDLRFMVTADECEGLQGWFIRNMGGFPVDTKHPGISSIRHSVELLCQEEALVMFPEGDIFRDGQLHPLKPGLARIALQVESSHPGIDLNIVPISIHYSQIFPHWGCAVEIKIGSPLKVASYSHNSAKKNAQQLTHDLEAALRQLAEGSKPSEVEAVKVS